MVWSKGTGWRYTHPLCLWRTISCEVTVPNTQVASHARWPQVQELQLAKAATYRPTTIKYSSLATTHNFSLIANKIRDHRTTFFLICCWSWQGDHTCHSWNSWEYRFVRREKRDSLLQLVLQRHICVAGSVSFETLAQLPYFKSLWLCAGGRK